MTYITYEKTQFVQDLNNPTRFALVSHHKQPPRKIPSNLPKPNFMPTYLVRTSDMKLVRGSDVHEGYCTLSYSWGQSGEVRINETTGKSYRIDQGKHKIIYSDRSKFVTFEGLIQELCKDFNIKYIWYDQMCINQDNEKEKHAEIHQMHKIYGNSYCALALMPELRIKSDEFGDSFPLWLLKDYDQLLLGSQWMKRMWTLEEAIMSSKMVVVGQNMHSWGDQLTGLSISLFNKKYDSNASRVLYYAHTRTSTNDHDHIFALANIFRDIMKEIEINYKQDIQELMLKFYGLLIKKDLGVLCFGLFSKSTKENETNVAEYKSPMQKFDLPSWTGINGEHFKYSYYKTDFTNYAVVGRALLVTCRGMTNKECRNEILSVASIKPEDMPPGPHPKSVSYLCDWTLVISIWSPSFTQEKLIAVDNVPGELVKTAERYERIIQKLRYISHFISIKEMKLEWVETPRDFTISYFTFDTLAETLQDSEEYIILPELGFKSHYFMTTPIYSVIKKNGDHYKAIGMVHTGYNEYLFDDFAMEEQTFEIH